MLRILGDIQAGWPSPAEEELIDSIDLNEYLAPHASQTFIIRVKGDSMIDAGIHPGDLAIVERGRKPEHRDVVIAEADGNWTMKYYEVSGKAVRLVAANVKYPPIICVRELRVHGVVVAVVRKIKR